MFETLTGKLTAAFKRLGSKGRLTEQDVDEALKEIRVALLEADVHFKVARDLVAKVRERALVVEMLQGLNPGQQVIKIVAEELEGVLGAGDHRMLPAAQPPTVVMLMGLQGSGKTTTAAKLALHLRESSGQQALLVAADLRRPAAIEQLASLGKQLGIPVYSESTDSTTLKVAKGGIRRAKELGLPWVILDTGGRLHIDEELMGELVALKTAISAKEALLIVDAMTGQDAVRVASDFQEQVGVTGLVLTKIDGDSRGGAALSVTSVTGVPIKFMGTGERIESLEPFHPNRLASRILGMGDVLTLIEKVQKEVDNKQGEALERKLRQANIDLQDFLDQLRAVRRMGPLKEILGMIPGFNPKTQPQASEVDESQMQRTEAIILSMTPQERRVPDILNASRRRRIALGSGTEVQDVNQLLNQFRQMQKMLKLASKSKKHGDLGKLLQG